MENWRRPPSDHFDGERFFNPNRRGANHGSLLWDLLPGTGRGSPVTARTVADLPTPEIGQIVVTFVNHATFLIQTDVGNILTDPVWANRVGPFRWAGPTRLRQPGIEFDALPPIRIVLISHDHYNHLDLTTVESLSKHHDPVFVTGLRSSRLLRCRGIDRIIELDWWQTFNDGGLCITMTPAQHGSGRHPLDLNRSLWGGFVIDTLSTRVFFAGDTGYTSHFRAIRRRCGSIDMALLPINCRKLTRLAKADHLSPQEAVKAHCDLGARQSVAMQFATFSSGGAGLDDPSAALRAALWCRSVAPSQFLIPRFGESIVMTQSETVDPLSSSSARIVGSGP